MSMLNSATTLGAPVALEHEQVPDGVPEPVLRRQERRDGEHRQPRGHQHWEQCSPFVSQMSVLPRELLRQNVRQDAMPTLRLVL